MILQTSPNKDLTSIHNWAGTGIVKKKKLNRSTVVEWDIGLPGNGQRIFYHIVKIQSLWFGAWMNCP